MIIMQVATLAFFGQGIPKEEILPAIAEHLTVATIATGGDKENSKELLHAVMKKMETTFEDYWNGNLNEDHTFIHN